MKSNLEKEHLQQTGKHLGKGPLVNPAAKFNNPSAGGGGGFEDTLERDIGAKLEETKKKTSPRKDTTPGFGMQKAVSHAPTPAQK